MKASEIQPGKTYVGKNGGRRYVRDRVHLSRNPRNMPSWDQIQYDIPQGGQSACSAKAFAAWAEREATPEERAP